MYKRVLLKLSGEALSCPGSIFDTQVLNDIAEELKHVTSLGVQVAIVVGGGNIIRGKYAQELNMPRVEADKMGMLGTLINALAVGAALEKVGVQAHVQSAIECNRVADLVDHKKAIKALEEGKVVIYGGGTGNPYFSTDTASSLRACEINCDAILMAKNGVDGVYTADPDKDPTATKYDVLTYQEILDKELQVIDATAASMCKDANIESIVFNMNDLRNISRVVSGEKIGTLIRR